MRDDRPTSDTAPPAVWFAYSPDRKGIHPQTHLATFEGVLQADAYAGFHALCNDGTIREAACWAHARRKFHDLHEARPTPLTTFGARGLVFAATYVAMQLGRTVFFLWAVGGDVPHLRRNFPRVLVWLTVSALLWIAGGLADGAARFICWTLALLIEFSGPWALFWVPGLGRSSLADWDVDGSHMAERCGLFIIIALGESLLVTGATFAELVWTADVGAAFLSALLGSIAMWWIYFDSGAERAHHRIKHSRDPGREARMAYTYCHVLIVAGVIVGAVADEITPAHTAHADGAGVAAILGGPALYLLGVGPFKWVSNERRGPPFSHLLGLALLAALAPLGFGHTFSALALSAATSAVPVFVAAWECVVLRRPGVPAA